MKYFSVILADDDYLVLQDLKTLVNWESLGFRIAGTASNGKTALSLARKCGMDLIITDISMPEMDGFDFIEAVLAEFPDTYIIIISSYADFNYARRAMKDGISDYILKNDISAESLASHLKKVKEYLENQAQKKRFNSRLELTEYFVAADHQNHVLEKFCHTRYIFLFFSGWIPLEKLKPHFLHIAEYGEQFYHKVVPALATQYTDMIAFSADGVIVVGIPCGDLKGECTLAAISETARSAKALIEKNFEDNLMVSFFPERLSISECRTRYRKILSVLQLQSSFPDDSVSDLSQVDPRSFMPTREQFPYTLLRDSVQHPEKYYEELSVYLDSLFEKHDADSVFMLYHNLLLSMEEMSDGRIKFPEKQFFRNRQELFGFLKQSYEEVRGFLSSKGISSSSASVLAAAEYMKKNLSDNSLTIEKIAEEIYLSPSRLSVLFKQETGTTVNEYLTELRIDQAVYLLENSNYKIYEIANMVGYKSSQYFSQIFRQKTGHSPLYYRSRKPLD